MLTVRTDGEHFGAGLGGTPLTDDLGERGQCVGTRCEVGGPLPDPDSHCTFGVPGTRTLQSAHDPDWGDHSIRKTRF